MWKVPSILTHPSFSLLHAFTISLVCLDVITALLQRLCQHPSSILARQWLIVSLMEGQGLVLTCVASLYLVQCLSLNGLSKHVY